MMTVHPRHFGLQPSRSPREDQPMPFPLMALAIVCVWAMVVGFFDIVTSITAQILDLVQP